MDVGKSLSFVFEDRRWLEKTLIGGLILLGTLVLSWTIIGLFVGAGLLYGYMVELVRNVRRHEPYPLPEWDNWGDKIVLGLKYGIVYLVWSLPLLVIWLPLIIFAILVGESGSDTASGIFVVVSVCMTCVVLLYSLLLLLVTPGITIRFAERGNIADGLAVSAILSFTREHLGDVILAVIVVLAVDLVATIVGLLLCGIGLLFTNFWGMMVMGHVYGQIGLDKGTGLTSPSEPRYDLSPDDIMPGVGELPAESERPDTA